MVIMNIISVHFPLEGRTVGDVSDLYPNYFTPADYTFSIWPLIYILIAVFIVNSFKRNDAAYIHDLKRIGYAFVLSCAFNILWLYFWALQLIGQAMLMMLGLWAVLVWIYVKLAINQSREVIRFPFRVYLAWVAASIIANYNIFLIDAGMSFMGIDQIVWTCILISIIVFGGFVMLYYNKDIIFNLVLIWALSGFAVKNGSQQSIIIAMTVSGIFILVCANLYVEYRFNIVRSLKSKLQH